MSYAEPNYEIPDWEEEMDEEEILTELWDLAPEECFFDEEDGLPDSYFGG